MIHCLHIAHIPSTRRNAILFTAIMTNDGILRLEVTLEQTLLTRM
jgi:hypothetical protein